MVHSTAVRPSFPLPQLLTERLAATQREKEDLRHIQRELEEELAAGAAPHRREQRNTVSLSRM